MVYTLSLPLQRGLRPIVQPQEFTAHRSIENNTILSRLSFAAVYISTMSDAEEKPRIDSMDEVKTPTHRAKPLKHHDPATDLDEKQPPILKYPTEVLK
jgi:hypothetical protein